MLSVMIRRLVTVVLLLWCVSGTFVAHVVDAEGLPLLKFFHKFSEEARRVFGDGWPAPPLNSKEHHQLLLQHDRGRHRRQLATAGELLTFSDGNATTAGLYDGLQYAVIEIGTPQVNFAVALDTATDLLWVPCECTSCATPDNSTVNPMYDPAASNTSSIVSCGSPSCSAEFSTCTALNTPSSGQCSYSLSYEAYLDLDERSSGLIFEDVVRFIPNSGPATVTSPRILLGCGQNQSGDNLLSGDTAASGIMGLGTSSFAVPSQLASSGVVSDSFSMCFNSNINRISNETGSGTIVFGDVGPPNLSTTPFQPPPASASSPAAGYYVGVDSITIGNETTNETISFDGIVLVDTGSLLTYLQTNVYNSFKAAYIKFTPYPTVIVEDAEDFFCFSTTDDTFAGAPGVVFNFVGSTSVPSIGFPGAVYNETLDEIVGFCVAVLDAGSINIIGAGFLNGYNVIFNRQKNVLGFDSQPDCSNFTTYPGQLAP